MSILHTPLFASHPTRNLGAGFHNIGSGVLRASDPATIKKVEIHYGERCGHVPLSTTRTRVLVEQSTPAIEQQMLYLSALFGKEIQAKTFQDFQEEARLFPDEHPLVVPYVNVPETALRLQDELGADSWGIPSEMTTVLKNKADFYQLVDELGLGTFTTPDYKVASIDELVHAALAFLQEIEELYANTGLSSHYPLGVMLRAAESDGNYGSSLLSQQAEVIIAVQDGNAEQTQFYHTWQEALTAAQAHLRSTIDPRKEARIVMSRYLDLIDSPGMSVVFLDGQAESLGWNGQLQKPGSKACVGTSSYRPQNALLRDLQASYEAQTTTFFVELLRKTAEKYGCDFSAIRGIANLDIMLPGPLEQHLQSKRKLPAQNYLAECNPRWTNYTDAILAVIGATRQAQTLASMRAVIQNGIATFDKYELPDQSDPALIRERVFERDRVLQQSGTRIICRMTNNPMGLIFAGDVQRAQDEFDALLRSLPVAATH